LILTSCFQDGGYDICPLLADAHAAASASCLPSTSLQFLIHSTFIVVVKLANFSRIIPRPGRIC